MKAIMTLLLALVAFLAQALPVDDLAPPVKAPQIEGEGHQWIVSDFPNGASFLDFELVTSCGLVYDDITQIKNYLSFSEDFRQVRTASLDAPVARCRSPDENAGRMALIQAF